MQKLYCYVDESGQDTEGEIFLVTVVIAGTDRDHLREQLHSIEQKSRKFEKKWTKSRPEQRRIYMSEILQLSASVINLYYSHYEDTRSYLDLTVLTTAKAIYDVASDSHLATVLVDGLGKSERHRFAAGLRKLNITVHKVRGMRDQSDEFIRLADAIAGLARDAMQGNPVMKELFSIAHEKGMLKKV